MPDPYSLSEARLLASQALPYLSRYLFSLVPIKTPGIGTMGVDKWGRVYYDPDVLNQWPIGECGGVLLHELLHLVLKHHARCRSYLGDNPTAEQLQLHNIAGDLVINQILEGSGVPLPKNGCFIRKFGFPANLTTEEYYDLLEKLPRQTITSGCFPGGPGSASDGKQRPWEHGAPSNDPADSDTPPGLTEHEQRMLDNYTAQEFEKKKAGRGRGTDSCYMERFASAILRPKVDPVRELLALIKFAVNSISGHGDYTWRKLPKRQPPGAFRLPAPIRPIPHVTVICDTSGSMADIDMSLSLGVIANVLRNIPQGHVKVITGDTSAKFAMKCFRAEQVRMMGGGGTDIGALIVQAANERPIPSLIICCTDAETPWCEPVGPRVVACVTRSGKIDAVPDWIEAVEVLPPEHALV